VPLPGHFLDFLQIVLFLEDDVLFLELIQLVLQ